MQRANNDIFDKEFLTTAASNENVSPDEAKVGTNLETIDNLEILEPLIEQTQNQSNQINKAVESNVSKKKQDVSNPPNRTNVSKKSKTILPRQQRIDKFLNASSKKMLM